MIYAATREDIETRRKAFIRKWRLKHRAVADSLEEAGDRLFTFTRLAAEPVAQCAHNKCHRTAARRVQAKDQNPDRAAVGRPAAMLFWALLASGQINMRKVDGWQTLAENFIGQPIDLAA